MSLEDVGLPYSDIPKILQLIRTGRIDAKSGIDTIFKDSLTQILAYPDGKKDVTIAGKRLIRTLMAFHGQHLPKNITDAIEAKFKDFRDQLENAAISHPRTSGKKTSVEFGRKASGILDNFMLSTNAYAAQLEAKKPEPYVLDRTTTQAMYAIMLQIEDRQEIFNDLVALTTVSQTLDDQILNLLEIITNWAPTRLPIERFDSMPIANALSVLDRNLLAIESISREIIAKVMQALMDFQPSTFIMPDEDGTYSKTNDVLYVLEDIKTQLLKTLSSLDLTAEKIKYAPSLDLAVAYEQLGPYLDQRGNVNLSREVQLPLSVRDVSDF